MRRVDLADQVLLSASGVTRLLDGLERQRFRRACLVRDRSAGRVRGADRRRPGEDCARPSESHLAQIDDALRRSRLDDDELAELTSLLDRLDEGDGETAATARPADESQLSLKFCQYRLGVGPRCPWYFEPIPSEPYGRSAGSVSWTNDSWPIFIRG